MATFLLPFVRREGQVWQRSREGAQAADRAEKAASLIHAASASRCPVLLALPDRGGY